MDQSWPEIKIAKPIFTRISSSKPAIWWFWHENFIWFMSFHVNFFAAQIAVQWLSRTFFWCEQNCFRERKFSKWEKMQMQRAWKREVSIHPEKMRRKEEEKCSKVHLRNIWFDNSTRHCKNASGQCGVNGAPPRDISSLCCLLCSFHDSILEKTHNSERKSHKNCNSCADGRSSS